jgi:hypothetical protein
MRQTQYFVKCIFTTEAQFRSLLKASAFELKSITPTATMISVIEGKPV